MNASPAHSPRPLRGDRNQCPPCGEYFNSTSAFDKHRTGEYGWEDPKRPGHFLSARRRCLSVAEMEAKGMVKNADGWWITSAMPKDAGIYPHRDSVARSEGRDGG